MKNLFNIFLFSKNKFIILIIALSLLKCLLIYLFYEWAVVTPNNIFFGYVPDSASFELVAKNLISGNGYSESLAPPSLPTMFKEPFYPWVISFIYFIFGPFFKYIVFFQLLLNPFIAVLIYFIGKEMFSEKISRFSAFLVSITPMFGEASFYIQTEGFCIPLLLLAVFLTIRAFKFDKPLYYFFAGLVLGAVILCRAMLLLLPLFFIILIFLGYGKDLSFHRPKPFIPVFRKGLIFIVGLILVVAPWMVRNKLLFNSYQLRFTGGQSIWAQATMAETFTHREVKGYLLYMFSGRLAQKYFPDFIGNDLSEFEYRHIRGSTLQKFYDRGIGDGEIDAYLRKEGIKKIIAHPFKYLRLSMILYLQVFKFFLPWTISCYPGRFTILNELFFPVIRLFSSFPLGLFISISAVLGVVFSRRQIARYLPALLPVVYYNSIIFFFNGGIGGVRRFILIVVPLYYLFVSVFLFRVFKIPQISQEAK